MVVLGVNFDTPDGVVESGSKVKGYVFAEFEKEVSGSSLDVVLRGVESCKVKYTTGTGDKKRVSYGHAKRQILELPIPVNSNELVVNGKVPPGQYNFPFEVDLPAMLPSTMYVRDHGYGHGEGGHCSIRYSVKVQLKGSGWFSDYKSWKNFTVSGKPLTNDPVPCFKEPITQKVNSCFCIGMGTITFGGKVDDTLIGRGETVKVNMSCINDTKVEIASTSAILTETVRWRAHGHSSSRHRTLAKVDFGRFGGLQKKSKSALKVQLKGDGGYAQNNLSEIFKQIEQGMNQGTVTMPVTANDTYHGQVIDVKHSIRIHVKTGGCCVADPSLVIPVKCGAPSRAGSSPPTMPGSVPEPDYTIEPIPNWTNEATIVSPVYVPYTAANVGGIVVEDEVEKKDEIDHAPMTFQEAKLPTLENLMQEMTDSVSDLGIIQMKVADPDWKNVFSVLSPSEFAGILQKVDLDFDQPKIAQLIAPLIRDGQFTCAYVIASILCTSDWNRSNMVEKLIPYCIDLVDGEASIKAQLTDWEQTVTAQAFKNALQDQS